MIKALADTVRHVIDVFIDDKNTTVHITGAIVTTAAFICLNILIPRIKKEYELKKEYERLNDEG